MSITDHIQRRDWDSSLQRGTSGRQRLTLILRVCLLPRDPTGRPGSMHLAPTDSEIRYGTVRDEDNQDIHCRSWRPDEWQAFKQRFETVVEEIWNGKLVLIVPRPPRCAYHHYFVSSPDSPAAVDCALDIQVLEPANRDSAHATLAVVHLVPNEYRDFKSFVLMRPGAEDGGVISHRDVNPKANLSRSSPHRRIDQHVAAHEVSHLLLLEHVACPENEDRCYGEEYDDEVTIRGRGDLVSSVSSRPWLTSIREHTGCREGWTGLGVQAFDGYVQRWRQRTQAPRR
jgi:hypothetical protein